MDVDAPKYVTLWLFNIAMENGPFIVDFPIKTSIYEGFSMAMLNNKMVTGFEPSHIFTEMSAAPLILSKGWVDIILREIDTALFSAGGAMFAVK